MIYFIRERDVVGGPVKIGCSINPAQRLLSIQTHAPRPLEIVATAPGNYVTERGFHSLFVRLHSHSEWFLSDPELEACITSIQAGSFDLSSLPSGPSGVRSVRAINVWAGRRDRAAARAA